uniref:Uncharacterized protein n=1 Tax=Timema monikensis TaxID=170555 RepID=A0A7R9EH15_9NEOP|nr:unnamed protein product [Timema monikensis]
MSNYYPTVRCIKAKYRSQAVLTMLVGVLMLTIIVTSLSLRVVYMWVIMVTAAIMLVTACVYTTCGTKPAHFTSLHRSSAVPSDTISTLSDHVSEFGFHQNALPPWITDLPPSYETVTASSSQTQRATTQSSQPPPYSTAVAIERQGLAPGQTSCEEDGTSLGCNSPRSSVLSGTMSYTSAMSDMSDSPSQTLSVTESSRTVSSRALCAGSITSWESYLPPAYEECSQISRLPEVIITPCHLEINLQQRSRMPREGKKSVPEEFTDESAFESEEEYEDIKRKLNASRRMEAMHDFIDGLFQDKRSSEEVTGKLKREVDCLLLVIANQEGQIKQLVYENERLREEVKKRQEEEVIRRPISCESKRII